MRCLVWVPQIVDLTGIPDVPGEGTGEWWALFVALRPSRRFAFRLPHPAAVRDSACGPGRQRAVAELASALLTVQTPPRSVPADPGTVQAEAALAAVAAADLAVPGPPLSPEQRCATAARLLAPRGAHRAGLPGPLWGRYLGGVTWVRHDLAGWRAERLPLPPSTWSRLAGRLLLVQVQSRLPVTPRDPGAVSPAAPQPRIGRDAQDREPTRAGTAAVAALLAGDWEALAAALASEGQASSGASDPVAAVVATAARSAGARAVLASHWAPGVMTILVSPARRGEVARAVRAAGAQPLRLRPAADGLRLAW